MTTLIMPDNGVRSVTFGNRRNTIRAKSPFTRSSQVVSRPGDQWFATYEIAVGTQAMRAQWQVFMMQASNAGNRFRAYDHYYSLQGTGNGTPLVNGADQVGGSLVTDGWAAGEQVLMAGDYLSVNNELKMTTEAATADSSGNATISFEPKIRVSPADNAAITLIKPYCLMRLIDDDQAQWEAEAGGYYRMVFSAAESFYNA